nr:unnamed protein product [Callosobruchus analis]
MVACRFTDTRNGGNATDSQVPLKKTAESEQYRDYESVFIIPGTSVDANLSDRNRLLFAANATNDTELTNADVTLDTNRRTSTPSTGGKKVMNHEADARDEANTTTANENAPTTVAL